MRRPAGGDGAHVTSAVGGDHFAHYNRAERVIAAGRVLLAACGLLTIWLTPYGRPPAAVIYALAAYGVYAVALGIVAWATELPQLKLRLFSHVVDVLVFALMYAVESELAGSFFVFFIFSLLSATLRWQWRGTLGTAALALGMALVMGVYQQTRSESFLVNQAMIRGIYFVVCSILVSYVVTYELHLRRTLSRLAAWPRTVPEQFDALLAGVLQEAAGVLNAPRMLITWQNGSEGALSVAEWTPTGLTIHREEASDTWHPIVHDSIADTDFFCEAIGVAPVIVRVRNRFRRWRLWPIHAALCAKFSIRSAMSVNLSASGFTARLFWLDKRKMITDDLILARLVAREASAHIDQFHLIEQRKRAAGADERIHLARNLHDGLLQSLTAIALKLEEMREVLAETSHAAEKNVMVLQRLILAEQRYLRHFIGHLKPMGDDPWTLAARLRLLAERVELEWSVEVEVRWRDDEHAVPLGLVDDVYYIVSEAVVNAARHSGASFVGVDIATRNDHVRIVVLDDGKGFPFQGRYEGPELEREGWGPAVLRGRVFALAGQLEIESTSQGSSVEVTLPFPTVGAGRAHH